MEQEHKQIRPRDEAVEKIECYIRRHNLAPQDKLPAEREMCEMWNLNRTTLRSAIRRLTAEGKLYSLKGSGTYVAPPKLERNLKDVKSTTESVRSAGHLLRNVVLDVQVIECNKFLSKKLEIPLGRKVFYLQRLRVMDSAPYMIECSYINYELCPGIEEYDFTDESLYRVLSYYGIYIAEGEESVGITYAAETETRYLEVPADDYLFFLSGVTRDAQGRLVEYFRSAVRADKVRFSTVLRRYRGKKERSVQE